MEENLHRSDNFDCLYVSDRRNLNDSTFLPHCGQLQKKSSFSSPHPQPHASKPNPQTSLWPKQFSWLLGIFIVGGEYVNLRPSQFKCPESVLISEVFFKRGPTVLLTRYTKHWCLFAKLAGRIIMDAYRASSWTTLWLSACNEVAITKCFWLISLASQTQPIPVRIVFSITHRREGSNTHWGWLMVWLVRLLLAIIIPKLANLKSHLWAWERG